MEKIININLSCRDDLVEKYDENIVSKDLINYLLEQTKFIRNKDVVKCIVKKNFDVELDVVKLIKDGLKNQYLSDIKKSYINNIRQILFLIIGILLLFLSTMIDNNEVFKEILLIGGWILIWEMIDLQIFSDVKLGRDRRMLKKLLKSDFIEK